MIIIVKMFTYVYEYDYKNIKELRMILTQSYIIHICMENKYSI